MRFSFIKTLVFLNFLVVETDMNAIQSLQMEALARKGQQIFLGDGQYLRAKARAACRRLQLCRTMIYLVSYEVGHTAFAN